jgi:hypothetical protein
MASVSFHVKSNIGLRCSNPCTGSDRIGMHIGKSPASDPRKQTMESRAELVCAYRLSLLGQPPASSRL